MTYLVEGERGNADGLSYFLQSDVDGPVEVLRCLVALVEVEYSLAGMVSIVELVSRSIASSRSCSSRRFDSMSRALLRLLIFRLLAESSVSYTLMPVGIRFLVFPEQTRKDTG